MLRTTVRGAAARRGSALTGAAASWLSVGVFSFATGNRARTAPGQREDSKHVLDSTLHARRIRWFPEARVSPLFDHRATSGDAELCNAVDPP